MKAGAAFVKNVIFWIFSLRDFVLNIIFPSWPAWVQTDFWPVGRKHFVMKLSGQRKVLVLYTMYERNVSIVDIIRSVNYYSKILREVSA